MKIAIVTITGDDNFGNRLQNYALETTLRELYPDAVVETLRNFEDKEKRLALKTRLRKAYRVLFTAKRSLDGDIPKVRRTVLFEKFDRENVSFSKRYYLRNDKKVCSRVEKEYDYFIAGSDQVWNPLFKDNSIANFLAFAPKNKSISYAASFGVDFIPKERQSEIRDYLKDFKAISVREEAGRKLVERIAGRRDAVVLLDPTLTLRASQWEGVMCAPKWLKSGAKYVLCYFLGGMNASRQRVVKTFAEENGCEVIDILDRESESFINGPSEFLWLEANATLICTDSFHAAVFAIIFKKPFVVFDRKEKGMEQMGSRMDTLLKTFHLENRRAKDGVRLKVDEFSDADMRIIDKVISAETKKSRAFLKDAIGENNGESE